MVQNILDSNSEHVAKHEGKQILLEEKILSVIDLDLIKCLKQIKYHILLLAFAPISELPSHMIDIGIVGQIVLGKNWRG